MRKTIGLIIILTILILGIVKLWGFLGSAAPIAGNFLIPSQQLKQTNGYTNVLLLGIGGGSHDGPNLTDTIILASINWKANKVTLVSVPRDLWVPDINNSVKKINEAYAVGGISEARSTLEEVTGQQIHYVVRLDFQGFVNAINSIGGVDVTVQRTLDDYEYPISGKEDDTCGHTPEELQTFNASLSASLTPDEDVFKFFPCRFMHLHFDPGPAHMNGDQALEFARSRHAVGIEGSDFARSTRQQLIIEAIRNKLISSAFLNPGKLLDIYNIMKSSIDTDINSRELGVFLNKAISLRDAKINSTVIDVGDYTTGRQGLLLEVNGLAEYSFADALIPRTGNGNFSEIQKYVGCEVTKGNCKVLPLPTPTQ